jgi:hypothetical protein
MGILLAFFAGWATCAKAGTESHDEVVAALKAVRDSDEVADLLAAMRSHAGFAMREFGNRLLDAGDGRPLSVPDVLARVRAMMQPSDAAR